LKVAIGLNRLTSLKKLMVAFRIQAQSLVNEMEFIIKILKEISKRCW